MFNKIKTVLTPNYTEVIKDFPSLVANSTGKVEWCSAKFLELIGETDESKVIGQDFAVLSNKLFEDNVEPEDTLQDFENVTRNIEPTASALMDSVNSKMRIKLSNFTVWGKGKTAAVFLNS